jgi:hypothetical protein
MNKIETLIELPVRVFGPVHGSQYKNIEADKDYYFKRSRIVRNKGVSALIRAKNEESNIRECLESIYDVFDEIVVVNNASDDQTLEKLVSISKEYKKIRIFTYEYEIARMGTDHNSIVESSVRSMAYYTNWCLSKCRYSYIFKWDADMMLSKSSQQSLRNIINEFSSYWPSFVELELQTLYKKDGDYYQPIDEINKEIMMFPNRADVYFEKANNFELLHGKKYSTYCIGNNKCSVFELKDVRQNEFSHWSEVDKFPSERKKREWANYNQVLNETPDPKQFTKLEEKPF